MKCIFCQIAHHELAAPVVFENEHSVAFLDSRPLFYGHTLLIPREHIVSFTEFPIDFTELFFRTVHALSIAIEQAMDAQGTFIAINNKVSQSIPHLHVHIVPRVKGDGLRGFFWPRKRYTNDMVILETVGKIKRVLLK